MTSDDAKTQKMRTREIGLSSSQIEIKGESTERKGKVKVNYAEPT